MRYRHNRCYLTGDPITMLVLIAAILVIIVVLSIVGFALHLLFSPWLLLAAVAILVWMKLRPRRSRG